MKPLALLLAFLFSANAAIASPEFWRHEWPRTDFSVTSVKSWTEIMSGGPPRDGIPALNAVTFHLVADEHALSAREPVITVELPGQVPRAYPLRYLIWHEIANDRIGDVPVIVTFCPLCNSGITFDRRVNGRELTFGVTGKLRNSDMIMFDRQTESWWQQAIGEGIVGEMTGVQLQSLPSWMEAWDLFAARNPDGLVMAQPQGYSRNYGANPYVQYDSSYRPFLFNGEMPPQGIPALARVVRVGNRAWPLTRLAKTGEIDEAGLVISWSAGQASALDSAQIGAGRDVGNVRVRDAAGKDVVHDVMFAFAFNAFWPDGIWMTGE